MHTERTTTEVAAADQATAKLPAVMALIIGVFMVFGTGLANSSTLHDAAHDVRHAFSFPCH